MRRTVQYRCRDDSVIAKLRTFFKRAAAVAPCVMIPPMAMADPEIGVRPAFQLAGDYFTAPLHWDAGDWTTFAGALGVIATTHEFDAQTRDHFADRGVVRLDGKDRNSQRDMYPALAMVAGTWAYATVTDSRLGNLETWHMAEAAGLSAVSAYALKFVAGRQRPNESMSADRWFSGGDSFPSLHTTAAFAIGTVLAESGSDDMRWVRRGIGYGAAMFTAYRRLHDNQHWLSDTVAGAALGVATSGFVLRRSDEMRWTSHLSVMPMDRGAMVSWSVPLQ
jgi:PAP2 superfamily